MRSKVFHAPRWLLPVLLTLFMCQVLLLPMAVGAAYPTGSKSPDSTLTYSRGRLRWDSDTVVREDGSAEMPLFLSSYQSVLSGNGDAVVAPGTENDVTIRIHNTVEGQVRYHAVLYQIDEDEPLPIHPRITGTGFDEATTYPTPSGVTKDQIVQAVTGIVLGGQWHNLTVGWDWDFFLSDEQDIIDTRLGNNVGKNTTVGVYIVVEDNNTYTSPMPDTGDTSHPEMYAALMGVSLIVLILLIWDRKKEKKEHETRA